jgi:plastocyanin
MATLLRSRLGLLVLLLGGLGVLSCGGDGDGGQPTATTTIAKAGVSGDEQTGTVGQTLASPLQVVVIENNAPKVGATVTWSATGGSGTVDPTSATTDAQGIASTTWTLGTTAGSQSAQATLAGADGSPVGFTATAEPGPASTLSMVSGDQQVGVNNTVLPQPLVVEVSDEFGNGIQGVDVEWTATNATLSATSVPTDASGLSQVTVTLGAEGAVTVTAAATGLIGSPVTFNATATGEPTIPTTATVRVGNIFFTSNQNTTTNPAVDTVAVGGTVTWLWGPSAGTHSVESTGSPTFTSSTVRSSGTYDFTFTTAGTYQYTCSVHPGQMTGRIVVR